MRGYKDLKVYQLAYKLAMEIFQETKKFPKEERYSLTDQIRRSSRSICAGIAEAWRKRKYPKHFISKLTDVDEECSETEVWTDFSYDCGYIDIETHKHWTEACEEIGRMLNGMIQKPDKFCQVAAA